MDIGSLIGQKVHLAPNKEGTLRYYGRMAFASGMWCGVELDEPDGENDGSVNNLRYFTCRKNYGIFCRASEIFKYPPFPESDEPITFQKDQLPADQNVFFEELSKNIVEKALCSEDLHDIDSENFEKLSDVVDKDLPKPDADLPFLFENFDEQADSDESLGILPLHLIDDDDDDEIFNTSCVDESRIFPFAGINCEEVSFDSMNIEHTALLLPKYSSPEPHCHLNVTQTIHSPEKQVDLNATLILQNPIIEFKTDENFFNIDKEFPSSPIFIVPKVSSHSKTQSSPIHKIASSPKYSSTPKHDLDSTFVIGEQKFSPVSDLNAVDDILKGEIDSSESNELDLNESSSKIALLSSNTEKNNLNTTCNIVTGSTALNQQCELDKTFNNVTNTELLPTMNTTITFLKELENKIYDLKGTDEKDISCDEKNATFCKNIHDALNTTSLSEKFAALNLNGKIPKASGFLLEKKSKAEEYGHISESALNIISPLSKTLEKSYDEEAESIHDETHILNTTYGKRDQLFELPKITDHSKIQKHSVKQTGNAKMSKIAKRIVPTPFSSGAHSCKFNELSEKKRKSICAIEKNNIKMANKHTSNRRQTFGSMPLKVSSVISPKSSYCIQQQDPISQTPSDSSSVRIQASSSNMSKERSKEKKMSSKSIKCKSKSSKSSAVFSKISSYPSSSASRISSEKIETESPVKSQLKLKQLVETIMITQSISDAEKTAIKKPKILPKEYSKEEKTSSESMKYKSKSSKSSAEFSKIPSYPSSVPRIFPEKTETESSEAEKSAIKKPSITPKKNPVICDLPKLKQPAALCRKSSLSTSKDCQKNPIEVQKKKTALSSRMPVKTVLCQKNNISCVPDSTSTVRRSQILERKIKLPGSSPKKGTPPIETNAKNLKSEVKSSESRKKDKNGAIPKKVTPRIETNSKKSSQSRRKDKDAAVRDGPIKSTSKTPEVKCKKKEDDDVSPSEKKKHKSPSRRSLR